MAGGSGGVPLVLKNEQPYQMPIPEGRAVYSAGAWQYEFDYKDHLGNTRVSFKVGGTPSNSNQLEKTAESSFDPWGVKLSVGVTNAVQNRWEMQGHEKESTFGLNRINYGNRTMNPLTGIFDRIDKFAEKYVSLSPFQVSANNPVNFIDVNGDFAVSVHYDITYKSLISLGYSKKQADIIAHYSSTYADHPPKVPMLLDGMGHGISPNDKHLSYRKGIDYTKTAESQQEKNSVWHSPMFA